VGTCGFFDCVKWALLGVGMGIVGGAAVYYVLPRHQGRMLLPARQEARLLPAGPGERVRIPRRGER
jgi:hypothetical protein